MGDQLSNLIREVSGYSQILMESWEANSMAL